MKISKRVLLLVLIVTFGLAFNIGTLRAEETKMYKIGAILPLTGNLAVLGEPEKNGMSLAVEEINTENSLNGKKIKIIFEDSMGKAKEGVTAVNKLIEIDKVSVLLASTTGISRSIAPIADSRRIPFLSLSMDPTIQKDSKYVFRLYESMGQEAEVLLSYFKDRKDINKVGILYVHHQGAEQQLNDYFIPSFKKMGIEVAVAETYEISEKDFKSHIAKIKASKVNYLLIIGYGFEYPIIFKELKQYDVIGNISILL
ncbi:MAG: ABC transporter substrate-binding protein [Nitrospirota bacterium]